MDLIFQHKICKKERLDLKSKTVLFLNILLESSVTEVAYGSKHFLLLRIKIDTCNIASGSFNLGLMITNSFEKIS